MKIAMISAEVAPFSKTGGLADVSGSLPKALVALGHEVLVITPAYKGIKKQKTLPGSEVPVHFIEHPKYFHREGIYGDKAGDYPDNHLRYDYFARASLQEIKRLSFQADIVHCHDWHTGLIPAYLKTEFLLDDFFRNTKSVFTIHNLAFQGLFSAEIFQQVDLSKYFGLFGTIEFWGKASFMKAALIYSDWITTVSPGYREEILTKEMGCGLEAVLELRSDRLSGILNGIDPHAWNPKQDATLQQGYDAQNIQGKEPNRDWLIKACGFDLNAHAPVVGMVTRLAEQKGFDLIRESFKELMDLSIRLVILGAGDLLLEDFFTQMNQDFKGQFKAFIGFDAATANRIYAGSDFFLMPSRFEPCGLGQLIAFRYGSIPIVHKTGGLADTVNDIMKDKQKGNGFVFDQYDSKTLIQAVKQASEYWKIPSQMRHSIQEIMQLDYSWSRSAEHYTNLYTGTMEAPAIKVHENRSIVIGLTGLSGSGKSTVRQFFENQGALTVDSDTLVHQALHEKAIQVRISKSLNIKTAEGTSQAFRQQIRKAIGADPKLLSKLESIIHPLVRVRLTTIIQQIRLNGGILVAEIPLLFETGMDTFFDETIVVTRDQSKLQSEATLRGWSQQETDTLIGRQMSDEEKCKRAKIVIENNKSLETLEINTKKIYEQLKNGGLNS